MDFNGAKVDLQARFATGWGTTTDIAKTNEIYTHTAQADYVGHEFVESTAYEPQVGRQQKRIRHEGIWTVKIFTDINSGIDITLSNKVKEICELQSLGIITTYSAVQTYSGKSIRKAFWEEQYAIRFTFDEIKT